MEFIDQDWRGVTDRKLGERVVIEPNFPVVIAIFVGKAGEIYVPTSAFLAFGKRAVLVNMPLSRPSLPGQYPVRYRMQTLSLLEPTAVAIHTLFTSTARPGDTIAVTGLGAIGLLVCYVAVRMGYRVLAYDRIANKVRLAEAFGALPINADSTTDQIARLWQTAQVHTIFECAGAAAAFTLAVEAAPRGATVVVAGLADKPSPVSEFMITRQGIQILTSLIYDHPVDFRRTIRLIESGFLRPGQIISSIEPFQHLNKAIEAACGGLQTKSCSHVLVNQKPAASSALGP